MHPKQLVVSSTAKGSPSEPRLGPFAGLGSHYVSVNNTVLNALVVVFRNGKMIGVAGGTGSQLWLALAADATLRDGDVISSTQYMESLLGHSSQQLAVKFRDILIQHNDNLRSDHYMEERILAPAIVGGGHFRRLPLDLKLRGSKDEIYEQPLYINGLTFHGLGVHNATFVATQNNWVYTFDADNGDELWSDSPYLSPASSDEIWNHSHEPLIYPKVGFTRLSHR